LDGSFDALDIRTERKRGRLRLGGSS
jgi:hypothetical protein